MSCESLSYNVESSPFDKKIRVPTSKSYANRLLVLAAVAESPTWVRDLPESTDVINMLKCFEQIGLEIECHESDVLIKNSFPACEKKLDAPLELHTGDGGTTNRFIIPLLARGQRAYHVQAEGGMRARPMQHLEEALRTLGVQMQRGDPKAPYWYLIQGPYQDRPPKLEVDSSISTQFPSGVALACADEAVEIIPTHLRSSRAYFDMTLELIQQFKAGQRDFIVPVDFSSLSYPLALALLQGRVTVENCQKLDPFQADSAFFEVLDQIGASYQFGPEGLTLKQLAGVAPVSFELDCSKCPDLVPTLAFVASYINGSGRLKNLEVLKHKESDRITEVINVLELFGVSYTYDQASYEMTITGGRPVAKKLEYTPPADHRIIMMTYLFMRLNQGGVIHEAQHVAKSFPNFFSVLS